MKKITFTFAIISLFIISPGWVWAGIPEVYGVAKYDFKLKSEPSFNGTTIADVKRGEKLSLIEVSDDWVKVRGGGCKVWAASTWLTIHGDKSKLPHTRFALPENLPKKVPYKEFKPAIHGNARFSVRTKENPSTNSPTYYGLKNGEIVTILGT